MAVPVAAFRVVFFPVPIGVRGLTTPSRSSTRTAPARPRRARRGRRLAERDAREPRGVDGARAARARTPPKNMFPFSGPSRAPSRRRSSSSRYVPPQRVVREGVSRRLASEERAAVPRGRDGWGRPLRDARTGRVACAGRPRRRRAPRARAGPAARRRRRTRRSPPPRARRRRARKEAAVGSWGDSNSFLGFFLSIPPESSVLVRRSRGWRPTSSRSNVPAANEAGGSPAPRKPPLRFGGAFFTGSEKFLKEAARADPSGRPESGRSVAASASSRAGTREPRARTRTPPTPPTRARAPHATHQETRDARRRGTGRAGRGRRVRIFRCENLFLE